MQRFSVACECHYLFTAEAFKKAIFQIKLLQDTQVIQKRCKCENEVHPADDLTNQSSQGTISFCKMRLAWEIETNILFDALN